MRGLEGHVAGSQICLIVRIGQAALIRKKKLYVASPPLGLNWTCQEWGPELEFLKISQVIVMTQQVGGPLG